jgi:tagatose 6-phosphate kinase
MILTITIHPILENRLTYEKIALNSSHRNPKEELKVGGKGINVSRQLNNMKVKNLAFTFLGGNNGKTIKNLLADEKIDYTFVQTKNETRYCFVTVDETAKSVTTYFGPDYKITETEIEEFGRRLDKMIQNCEIVIFSGSSPCHETDSIFISGIGAANKYDKISVCDTYGNYLKDCIEMSPTILHNNISELESSLRISLKSENEKISFLNHLYAKGIKQTFITHGKENTYAANFDYHYKVENPGIKEIDATGSGDCFISGIVYGLHKGKTFEESLKLGSALGALNATSFDVCNVEIEEAEKLADKVKIFTVGKKMKKIDVTPG